MKKGSVAMAKSTGRYEEIPALQLRGPELRRSMRTFIQAFMFSMIWMACIAGSQMKILCRMIGFDDFEFGALGSLPFIAAFGQVISAVVIEKTNLRKRYLVRFGLFNRLSWVIVAAIPLLWPGLPSAVAVRLTLIVLGLGWFFGSMMQPAWMSWIGNMVPKRIRGRYMAARIWWGQPIYMVAVIAIGFLLDACTDPNAPETAAAQPMLLYACCGILVAGQLFGLLDLFLISRIRDVMPRIAGSDGLPTSDFKVAKPSRWTALSGLGYGVRTGARVVHQTLLEPLTDRGFRHYVLYAATITFAVSVGAWFFWLQAMENLGFSKLAANILLLVVGPLSGMLSAKMWGRLIDRLGRRPVLVLATLGTLLGASVWFLVTRDTPAPQFIATAANWLSHAIGTLVGHPEWTLVTSDTPLGAYLGVGAACMVGGCFWTGMALAQMSVMLGFADGKGQSRYLAASAVLVSFGGVLGGLVGGAVAQSLSYLQDAPIVLGPLIWNNYHATFALSVLGQVVSLVFLWGMPDPGATRVRHLIRMTGANIYNAIMPRFFSARSLGRHQGPADRESGRR